MSITIQINPDLEKKLLLSAAQAGMDVNQYVIEILQDQYKTGVSKALSKEEKENDLLQKINRGLPIATWKRYNYLKVLRKQEQLDPEEHEELIHISDQIEEANATRMKYLVELARLREIPLRNLIKSLGIKTTPNWRTSAS